MQLESANHVTYLHLHKTFKTGGGMIFEISPMADFTYNLIKVNFSKIIAV